MPWTGADFSPRDLGEIVIYTFDFSRNLAPGETINTGVFQAISVDGLDPLPATLLSGGALINGAQLSQLITFAGRPITPSVPRLTYRLIATITTTLAQTLSAFSQVSVTNPEGRT